MLKLKYIVPNSITSINLFSGCCAILFTITNQNWQIPVFFLLVAAAADLLDGLSAKLLNATSEFGKQLDSLADMVSFGVAPSVIMFQLLCRSEGININSLFDLGTISIGNFIPFLAFILTIFSAIRLAKFNISPSSGSDFKGLPVPASTMFVVSIWIIIYSNIKLSILNQVLYPPFLIGVILLLSALMVSNITMLSLKFDGFGIRLNIWRYILVFGALIIYMLFGLPSLIIIMIYYILLSIIKTIFFSQ